MLERCAAAGRPMMSPPTAASMMMSANVGVALSLVSRAALYPDLSVSGRVRDAMLSTVVISEASPGTDGSPGGATSIAAAVTAVASRLRADPPIALTAHETALLLDRLARVTDTSPVHARGVSRAASSGTVT